MAPERIERLQVRGFKTFADAAVEMKPCNILIGGNGAGKSNLLSLLKMLRALGRGELQVYVENSGRANDVLRRAVPSSKTLEVAMVLRTSTGRSSYRLLAERSEDDRLLIRSEEIESFDLNEVSRGAEGQNHAVPVRESQLSEAAHLPGERTLFPPMQLLTGLRVFHFSETAVAAPATFECDFGHVHVRTGEVRWKVGQGRSLGELVKEAGKVIVGDIVNGQRGHLQLRC